MADYRDSLLLAKAIEERLITVEQATEALMAVRENPDLSIASIMSDRGWLSPGQTHALSAGPVQRQSAGDETRVAVDMEKTIAVVERREPMRPQQDDLEQTIRISSASLAIDATPPGPVAASTTRTAMPDDEKTIVIRGPADRAPKANGDATEVGLFAHPNAPTLAPAEERPITLQLAGSGDEKTVALETNAIKESLDKESPDATLTSAGPGGTAMLPGDAGGTVVGSTFGDLMQPGAKSPAPPPGPPVEKTILLSGEPPLNPPATIVHESSPAVELPADAEHTVRLDAAGAKADADKTLKTDAPFPVGGGDRTAAWSTPGGGTVDAVTQDAGGADKTAVSEPGKKLHKPDPVEFYHREISSAPQLRGKRRYVLQRELARGGLGKVWLSQDQHIARQVAIKELLPAALKSPAMIDRFYEEAQVTGQLEHPGIVPIYELGLKDDNTPFIAMKLLSGRTFSAAIKDYHALPPDDETRPLKFSELLTVFVDICNAMAYAHNRGVIHRDLKPANVMLGDYGEAIVVDWGLAKAIGARDLAPGENSADDEKSMTTLSTAVRTNWRTEESQTIVGSILGTPAYMPPEQAYGENDKMDSRSDVYSLGAILYEILAGKPPYRGKSGLEIVAKARSGRFESPREVNPSAPPELNAVCMKALAFEAKDRYASALLLAEDVKRYQADEPVSVYPERWTKRARRWLRRHRTTCVVAGGLLATALVVTAVWRIERAAQIEQDRSEITRQLLAMRQEVSEGKSDEVKLKAAAARFDGLRRLAQRWSALKPWQTDVETLAKDVDDKLSAVMADKKAKLDFNRFGQLYDEAILNGTLLTGTDNVSNLERAKDIITQALSIYGMSADSTAMPTIDDAYLNPDDVETIRQNIYELFLIYANAVAYKLPNQSTEQVLDNARQALEILSRAEKLGYTTKAIHLLRREFANRINDQAASAAAEKLAVGTESKLTFDFFLVGIYYYYEGKFDDALKQFDAALRTTSKHFWSNYFAAVAALQLGRPGEAVAYLNACRTIDAEFPWIYILRGNARGIDSLGLLAGGAARDIVEPQLKESYEDFERALAIQGDHHAGVYINRAALRLEQARLDPSLLEHAVNDLLAAIKAQPQAMQSYVNLARAYWLQKKPTQAYAEIERAIKVAPQSSVPLHMRASFYLEQEQWEPARKDIDMAIRISEDAGRLATAHDYALRGEVREQLGKAAATAPEKSLWHNQAVADYDRALAINPRFREVYKKRSLAFRELGNIRRAFDDLNKWVENNPAASGTDFANRGFIRLLDRDVAGAIGDITQALKVGSVIEPEGQPLRIRRAWAFVNSGPSLALDDFDYELARAKPGDPNAADWLLGRAYVRMLTANTNKAIDAALRDAETAVALIPKVTDAKKQRDWTFNAACVYAQAVAKVAFPPDDVALQTKAKQYHDTAIRLLRQSVNYAAPQARSSFISQFFPDPALAPIHNGPEFKKLVAEHVAPVKAN